MKRYRIRSNYRQFTAWVLLAAIVLSLAAGVPTTEKVQAAEKVTLHNPVVDMDAMCAGQKVTWDCVYFGSYPQTEIEAGDSEYAALESAQGWDGNGDAIVNGVKYRRMLKGDATNVKRGYDWKDDATYHYFRYEPIKWRVLETDGSNAMLLSDIVLDNRKYNTEHDTTWETSTIRSWLNGYGADMNQEGVSYSSSNFIDSAFMGEEQSAIADTNVVDNDNHTESNTVDKLFLLSKSEVYTDMASKYGFMEDGETYDEARRCKSSAYAKAMGVEGNEATEWNCYWWLRSPDYSSYGAAEVLAAGNVTYRGYYVYDYGDGVRVALNLNLTSSNLYTYAGTVCSDGIVDGSRKTEGSISNPRIVKVTDAQEGQNVKWDSVYFGNYPQTEVKDTDREYAVLQSAEGWDNNGDIVVNGTRYRRMLKGDTTYHYFRYEPVKWRVLKTDGSNAMLLSDIVLDGRKYNTEEKSTTWETSTIRSWLNGYNADMNREGINYSNSNFIDSAFTIEEQSLISYTNVVNNDGIDFGTEGGNDTMDKLFLLSESEIYTKEAKAYGFLPNYFVKDISRRCKSSDYAKAMGVYSDTSTDYKGNCYWWLRSPGCNSNFAANVDYDGNVHKWGYGVDSNCIGVRVALNLNLSSTNLYTYAGTVCSDGTVNTTEEPTTEQATNETPGKDKPTIEQETTEEPTTDKPNEETPSENTALKNPLIVKDLSMKAGQKVMYDCVWFGSYPQTEMKAGNKVYAELQTATEWDENNEIVINGIKYRRMLKSDATYATSGNKNYYDWNDSTIYHYFRYEPVKWRVLKSDGNTITLLSDVALDDRQYSMENKSVTWENSALRSWLNGYGAGINQSGTDYSSNNFINSAFSVSEQNAILNTDMVNDDNILFGTEGGSNTTDKLFLLSESELYTDNASIYGFISTNNQVDEARVCKSSEYAKAMGVYSYIGEENSGGCWWWLRSPGNSNANAADVLHNGTVYINGSHVRYNNHGVRVALNLNISSSGIYTYAGTVCSDGTVTAPVEPEEKEIEWDMVNLSSTEYNYDGKVKKPEVTVTDDGVTLAEGEDYTVKYEKGRKNVGFYEVTITGIGNYTGEVYQGFNIYLYKGKTYTVGSMKYKLLSGRVDSIYDSAKVSISGSDKKTISTLTIKDSVKIGGVDCKITEISGSAFKKYTNLRKAVVGKNVTKIGTNAFSGCSKLKTIQFKGTKLKAVGKNAIKGIYKNTVIKVPSSCVSKYKKLFKSGTGFVKTMKVKK